MPSNQGILDDIRDALDDGATLSSVTSTDDRLVLVMASGGTSQGYRLDPEETQTLIENGLIDRLTSPARPTEALVQG